MTNSPSLVRLKSMPAHNRATLFSRPRVAVLMSTYNGERFLEEQINSISAQKGVEIKMFVRDDGSSDETGTLLKRLSASPHGCITTWQIEFGSNKGCFASFEYLLSIASDCAYYAFSDQDDFWFPEKLSSAIRILETDANPAILASSVEIVDEDLTHLGQNTFPGLVYSLPAELIRHRLSGHTMVWNQALQTRLQDYIGLSFMSHDQLVVIAALLVGANLYFDESSHVLHRRLADSITPGGLGISKRLSHEFRMMWNPERKRNRALLAEEILSIPDVQISVDDKGFLDLCARCRRLALICNPDFDCGLLAGNVEAALSVMLGRF